MDTPRARRTRVYIAGPMTGGNAGSFNLEKIHEAIEAYFQLIEAGFVPHCPHLTVFCEFMQPNRISWGQWLELDQYYIDDSDAVLRIPGVSPGADRECAYARHAGIPVTEGLETFLDNYESTPI